MADGMNSFVDRSPLPERLAEIRARHPSAEPDAIAEVVRAVLCTMKGDLSGTDTSLLTEVEELGRTIARAKAEIAALKVDDISAPSVPTPMRHRPPGSLPLRATGKTSKWSCPARQP